MNNKNKLNKTSKYIMLCLISLLSFSEITPDGKTNVYVEKSNNGTEVINISTPSDKGVSDSTFDKFNVDKKGAVINNSSSIARSHIAGVVRPNENITKNPAKLALLRVTSTNKSEIKGVLEALSNDDLDVVLSNKNGITLDGAKFLNIHDMTLTTGEVTLKNGNVDNISVGDGLIVSLDELNTSNVNRVNILSKVVELKKDLIANKIEILTGNNIYDIKGSNVEIVKTHEGEVGIPISANILGSVHANTVRIIATKSGIGAKSILAKNVELDSKTQAKVDKIKADKVKIKVKEDFSIKSKGKDKRHIIANDSLSIEANNISNDGELLLSNVINLKAKNKLSNLNGGVIHADEFLKIRGKKLDNKGKVLSFGKGKVIYIDKTTGKKIDDIEKWKEKQEEVYRSYNALKQSTTDEAKINALSAFYDKVVVIDDSEFDYRIYKDKYLAKENKDRIGTKGKFYNHKGSELLSEKNIDKVKQANKEAMYSEYSDNYDGEVKNKLLDGKLELSDRNTVFSVLSGNNVDIQITEDANNKDGHIVANEKNYIKANEFNNSSSIGNEIFKIEDGYEKIKFKGTFDCPGALVYCNIRHNVTYSKELDNERIVNTKALKSQLVGNVVIDAKTTNFKAYKEDEVKKTATKEDIVYKNKKEAVEIKGKKIEYDIEDDVKYTSIKNLYSNPNFLNSIKYNKTDYIIDEFGIDETQKDINAKKSNITINASKLNIKDQELIYNDMKLSSDDIKIIASNISADEKITIKSNNLLIKDEKSETTKIINEKNIYGDTVEKRKIERSKASNLNAKNILIDSKNTDIVASNLDAKEKIELTGETVNISNSVSTNTKEINSTSVSNILILPIFNEKNKEIKEQVSNSSNISAKDLVINTKKTTIKDSNVVVNSLKTKGDVVVTSDTLEDTMKLKENSLFDKRDIDISREKAKGSNILIKDKAEFENLSLISSKLQAKDLEVSDKLNVEAKVLKSKEKSKISSFKLIDDVQAHYTTIEKDTNGKLKLVKHSLNGNSETEDLSAGASVTLFSHKVDTIMNMNQMQEQVLK
ncbi:filamentous hemagglutinin N-terminal domain-containing protein [Oceanivirga salmonicida]|uniref:filamentous hemagglutinin N-terminal domain-containing protein n=1 Tax=Oceanivirga salmonicida TaxID=1769291 RepID=UPI00082A2640|nr:filamentous hemagglutinin N-terminal domain-containing protein [Oceanivirga salmonicida]